MSRMVARVLEQERAIRVVLGADRKTSHLILTWQDIDVLQSIDRALSPLLSLTDILSGESYVTVSAVLPMLQLIEGHILKEDDADTPLTRDLKRRIVTDLVSRYPSDSDVSEMLQLATFLDPRFKCKPFSELVVASIKEAIIKASISPTASAVNPGSSSSASATTYTSSVTSGSFNQSQPGSSGINLDSILPLETQPLPAKRKKKLGTFFKEQEEADQHETSSASVSPEQKCSNEIDKYLSIPKLDFEDDPLLWWKNSFLSFPILASLARKYLCVCATSSASERVFSCSGKIVSPLRSSMKPEKVNMLTFLSKNLN